MDVRSPLNYMNLSLGVWTVMTVITVYMRFTFYLFKIHMFL